MHALLATSLVLSAGCNPAPEGSRAAFREVSGELGVPPSAPYPDGQYFIPELMGGGVALFDLEGDGDLDLYQVIHPPPAKPFSVQLGQPAPNRLYRQENGGRLVEVAGAAGVADPGYGQGVAVGDIDNDGRVDLYVTNLGPNRLFKNRGPGAGEVVTFEDLTSVSGLDDETSRGWSTSAAFLDADQDGALDLFVVNYVDFDASVACTGEENRPEYCGPTRYARVPSALYRNRGDGTFTNITSTAGVGKPGRGLAITCVDLTGDGRVDIYVANDRDPNFLWVQQADGTFRDEAPPRGAGLSGNGEVESSMGVAAADLDGNGLLDVLVTNLTGETNTLYMAQAPGQFADRSASAGLSAVDYSYTGWGCVFFDLEGDGDQDLAIVNGRIARSASAGRDPAATRLGGHWSDYAQRNLLFTNDGQGKFGPVSPAGAFTAEPGLLRGLAVGDLDRDGDLDLVASGVDNVLRIYRNELPPPGRWLLLRAVTGKRDALGAVLRISLREPPPAQAKTIVRPVVAAQSYLSSSDPRVLLPLGAATTVESVEVTWPGGVRETFRPTLAPGPPGAELTLREGAGEKH